MSRATLRRKIALNEDVSLIDVVTDLSLVIEGQVLDAGIRVDASGSQRDLVGRGLADTINIGGDPPERASRGAGQRRQYVP